MPSFTPLEVKENLNWQEVSRVEALSDAVFGFAITLLVVSLEVPQTFDALLVTMRGFIAFAICFTMLILVWYQQYKFFRRYGLNDVLTFVLNAALLFVVLFYVYPLKFVWTLMVNLAMGADARVHLPTGETVFPVRGEQMGSMMIVFGIGYAAVFAVFSLLYWRAYTKRAELQLTRLEVFDTRTELEEHLLNFGVGLFSISLAGIGGRGFAALAGWSYVLIGPLLTVHGTIMGKKRRRLETALAASAPDSKTIPDHAEAEARNSSQTADIRSRL